MMRPQPTAVAAVRCSTQVAKSSALILPTLTDSLVAVLVFQSNLSVDCWRKLTSAQSCVCRHTQGFTIQVATRTRYARQTSRKPDPWHSSKCCRAYTAPCPQVTVACG